MRSAAKIQWHFRTCNGDDTFRAYCGHCEGHPTAGSRHHRPSSLIRFGSAYHMPKARLRLTAVFLILIRNICSLETRSCPELHGLVYQPANETKPVN